MKTLVLFVCVSVLLLLPASYSSASRITYYDVSFDSPIHKAGESPATGAGTETPSGISSGNPVVGDSIGAMDNQHLVFNLENSDNRYDQIRFELGYGVDNYSIGFDLLTENVVNTGALNQFSILLDTPQIRRVDFLPDETIKTYVPYKGLETIGSFDGTQLLHMDINIDLADNKWDILMNNNLLLSDDFKAWDSDIFSVRFSLGNMYGKDYSTFDSIHLDNILITSNPVPEPSTIFLLSMGLIGLSLARHRHKIKR